MSKFNYASLVGVEPSSTQYGTLGERVIMDATSTNQKIASFVTSTGVWSGGINYEATSSDTDINHIANSGEMEWVYVYNDSGSTIQQGQHVEADASKGPFSVVAGGGAKPTVGVAQFDIPTAKYAWVLVRGKGRVLLDSSGCSAEDALTPAASGEFDVSTTREKQVAHAGAAISASSVGLAFINCGR